MSEFELLKKDNDGTPKHVSFPDDAVLSIDKRQIFVFEENKMKYKARNVNKIEGCMLQIDGRLMQGGDLKCDNGLLLSDGRFYLIELKGTDVNHACNQIIKTYNYIKENFSSYSFNFFGRIVAKKGIPATSTYRQNLTKKLNNQLLIRENIIEEDV